MIPDLFIVGTGTNVGKTVVSLLLMHLCVQKDLAPFYLKPFQTGVSRPGDPYSDAYFISQHISGVDPEKSTLFCYQEPKAPWIAARKQGLCPDIKLLNKMIKSQKKYYNPVIIEGAGGLMVPLDAKTLLIDILSQIKTQVILVGHAGLGTINHTLLSLQALKAKGILPWIVLSAQGTPVEMLTENIQAIRQFAYAPVINVVKEVHNFSDPEPENLQALENLFRKEDW